MGTLYKIGCKHCKEYYEFKNSVDDDFSIFFNMHLDCFTWDNLIIGNERAMCSSCDGRKGGVCCYFGMQTHFKEFNRDAHYKLWHSCDKACDCIAEKKD